jgi:protein-tyrosine kinase
MSKFFEAVTKMDPQLSDPSLPAVLPQPKAAPSIAVARTTEVSVIEPVAVTTPVKPALTEESTRSGIRELYELGPIRESSIKLTAGSPVLPFDGADERAAERYRVIRTKLRQDQKRVLCISSSGMGDGKSVTAVNIAGVLALKRENRVLLVDGDFRRSTLANMLGLPQTPGLSEVLAGEVNWREAMTRLIEAPNLYFMPAGEQSSNPAELLDSTRWKTISDTFRDHFNFVVIDSPPMRTVADYDLIQSVCDGVIVVARQDHSNRTRLLKAIETVPADKMIGLVMNCVSPWTLRRTQEDADPYGYKPASK